MGEAGVEAAVLTSMHNIAYYSGFLYCAFGRPYGLVVTDTECVTISAGIDAVGVNDFVGGNSGYIRHIIRCIFLNGLFEGIKSLGTACNILLSVEIFFDDDMHQTVYPGDIGTQILTQPFIRKAGYFNSSGINNNQFGPF